MTILTHDCFPAFVRQQIEDGMEPRDVEYLLAKPWKWAAEFGAFCRELDGEPLADVDLSGLVIDSEVS